MPIKIQRSSVYLPENWGSYSSGLLVIPSYELKNNFLIKEQTAPMMNASANLQTAIAWQPYNEPAQQEETILQSRIKMITY